MKRNGVQSASGRSAIRVVPSARRLVSSLRDLGYDFPQAVADLVDNSITAEASRVDIDLVFSGPDSWLRVVDDGHGMNGDAITEAMRYGSHQSYEEEDLGKFGLGLKTASLSQCRQLTVASRTSSSRRKIVARQLDLDHVCDSDSWEIFELSARERDDRLVSPLKEIPGTVVLWSSLDRVLGYKIPWGKRARSSIEQLSKELALHLGMVFHRFISGEVHVGPHVQIRVNGTVVPAWDPFARDEDATQVLPACDFDVEVPDGIGLVHFQPYVLPPRESFSSEEAFHRLAGPRRWNAQQGLYIYRANRMIQSGGWSRMRAFDEHLKLARASLDFYPDLDPAFEINVAKVRAVLPADLRERLRPAVEMVVRVAQAAYRKHPDREAGHHNRGGVRITPSVADAVGARIRPALEEAAGKAAEKQALRRIVRQLAKSDSEVKRLLGW